MRVKTTSGCGVAFPHKDGEGFNLLPQAMPFDGKIVLRTYKEEDDAPDNKKKSFAKK